MIRLFGISQCFFEIVDLYLTLCIDTILAQKAREKIYVLIRGMTGKGKSTLINALLCSDGLLPTSSNRACTAVAVEISYNYSDDETEKYRAEIEFITQEEWSRELEILFEEVRGHFSDSSEPDQEKDLDRKQRLEEAVDKLKFIYPNIKTIKDLRETSIPELLENAEVIRILSTTTIIRKKKPKVFSAAVRWYIDSGDEDDERFAFWPFVKVVKIYVKSPILETGITLVDLPGSMDTNAARRSVSEKYLKKASVNCMVDDMRRGTSNKDGSSSHLYRIATFANNK